MTKTLMIKTIDPVESILLNHQNASYSSYNGQQLTSV